MEGSKRYNSVPVRNNFAGATENARNEVSAPSKMQVVKMQDMKMRHHNAWHENTRHENTGKEKARHENAGNENSRKV